MEHVDRIAVWNELDRLARLCLSSEVAILGNAFDGDRRRFELELMIAVYPAFQIFVLRRLIETVFNEMLKHMTLQVNHSFVGALHLREARIRSGSQPGCLRGSADRPLFPDRVA